MENQHQSIEHQLAVYKEFYQEEVGKRKAAEDSIKALEEMCNNYRNMFYDESTKRLQERENASRELIERGDESAKAAETRTREIMLKTFVEILVVSAAVPILEKFSGCSWPTFFQSLFLFPPLVLAFVIVVEFFGVKIRRRFKGCRTGTISIQNEASH